MTTPIQLRMGSAWLLPVNWMYLWCKVITRVVLRLKKKTVYSLAFPSCTTPHTGSHEPPSWKSWLWACDVTGVADGIKLQSSNSMLPNLI